jgi:hypothetical protein
MRNRSKKLCKRKDYQGNEYEYQGAVPERTEAEPTARL